jgi:hypothetical protein
MIVIFPEGGRRWDGKPKPMIETTLKLFWKMRIPVHPVQIHGSYLGWPRWADNYRKGSVELRFLDPVHASDFKDYDTFAEYCRELISFDEYHPPEDAFPKNCKKPASGIQRFLYRCHETGIDGAVFSPDGIHVYSREAAFRYRMDAASRLIDNKGNAISIIDLYDKINRMPMVSVRHSEGVILEKQGSQIYKVDDEHQLVKLDRAYVELRNDRLLVLMGAGKYDLPLEEIRYISVEQNHKVTVTTPKLTLQIDLEGTSALQWQLYINRLKKGEKPVRSV